MNENSPADLAGLQSGDVITEFNEHAVQTPGEFKRRAMNDEVFGSSFIALRLCLQPMQRIGQTRCLEQQLQRQLNDARCFAGLDDLLS